MKVTFFSPGTFVSETTEVDTDLTDPNEIKMLALDIVERHAARPYGFRLETEPKRNYFLGGTIKTLEDIPDTPENRILRSNMVNNNLDRVIENVNSWKVTLPFNADDVLLEWVQP